MDGYSVTEAASVLGVPTERVWELLARGVLSGAPEGDTGMRVYLQPRPQPAPPSDDPRPNGGSAEPEREASPFRELLTEFRSLTERYGQALLALGESRGEVAALRSRVDLLEARMDLRLPMGSAPGAPWPAPAAASREAPVPPMAAVEPAAEHAEEEEHRTRRRGPRRATESFAEALARAEDPSIPELPAAAAAAAALRAETPDTVEPTLPRELPPADMVPVADEPGPDQAEPEAAAGKAPPPPEPDAEPVEAGPASSEPEAALEAEATASEEATDELPAFEVEPEPVTVEAEAPMEPVEDTVSATEDRPVEAEEDEPTEPAVAEPMPVEDSGTTEPAEAEPVEAESAAPESEREPMAELEPDPDRASEDDRVGAEPGLGSIDEPAEETVGEDADWAERVDDQPEQPTPEPVASEATEPAIAVAVPEPSEAEEAPSATDDAQAPPVDFDADRYTSAIGDPDWFEAEAYDDQARFTPQPEPEPTPEPDVEPAADERELEPEPAPEPEPEAELEPEPEPEPEPELEPERDPAAAAQEPARDEPDQQRESAAPDEETMLWFGRRPAETSGADEMEVASGSDASVRSPLPGSQELDEAMVALDELTRRTEAPEPGLPDEWPPRSVGLAEPAPGASNTAMRPRPTLPMGRPGSPATRAYRRLRRIFPG